MRSLRRAEHSRRLLLLRALIDQLVKRPELAVPLPPPEAVWELLERAEFASPAAVAVVLDYPYTGSWLSYTMRLVRSGIAGVAPLWVHAGYLHSLSAAAAIRAGIDFETELPVWHGGAILPTIGLVRLPTAETHSVAAVRGTAGTVRISTGTTRIVLPDQLSTGSVQWWPIRRLAATAARHELSVYFDDVDPYRGSYEPVVHQRVGESEMAAWQRLLPMAWTSLVECLPDYAEAMATGLEVLGPLPVMAHRPSSESNGDAFGSAMIGLPEQPHDLAAALVHEFQHIRLSGLTHIASLCQDDRTTRFYVPWRDDPRPIAGVLQGSYAFLGVCAYWRELARQNDDDRAQFEFSYHRLNVWRAISGVLRDNALTETGQRFVSVMAATVRAWQDEPVSAAVAETARLAAMDHYLGWRLRHLRPDPGLVTTLSRAWLTGVPDDVDIRPDRPPTPVPDGEWSHARTALLRLAMTGAPVASRTDVPDATAGDAAWATGRFDDAVGCYRAELAADPDRPASWAGLATALSTLGPSPASRMLLDRPELVRAVHRSVAGAVSTATAPQPEEIASWLTRVVG